MEIQHFIDGKMSMNSSRNIVAITFLASCCLIFTPLFTANQPKPATYEFYGQHFTASYKNCDAEALSNTTNLIQTLKNAIQASGATLLNCIHVDFPGGGMTAVYLLSESHASVHTYPEHAACFVDLFTCGNKCSHEAFHEILESYLKPTVVNSALCIRS
jgi:S-adenosylmethionine decarboxylase